MVLLGLVLVLGPSCADAINPETLLMPGKLTRAHAKYEEQCSLCHDRSDRNRQTRALFARVCQTASETSP